MQEESESKIFAVNTVMGREREAADLIDEQDDYKGFSLRSILVSPETHGYVFVEAPDVSDVLRATEGVRLVRRVVEKPASQEDVERIMNPRPVVARVSHGDAVEITEGRFEGERGRITNISHSNKEATVKIRTSAVPFSTTIGMEEVRPAEKNQA